MNHSNRCLTLPLLCLTAGSLADCKGALSDRIVAGDVSLCAGVVGQPPPDTGFTWDLEGDVLGDVPGDGLDTAEPCHGASRVLEVAADDGETYHLGYTFRDQDDEVIEARLGPGEGDHVHVELLATIGYFYTGYGLVLRQDDALVAAVADNREPRLDEISVEAGRQVASVDDACGERRGWEMVFTGDDTLKLAPVSSGTLSVAGIPMTAWAFAAWNWDDGAGSQCTDLLGFWEWAMIRSD